MEQEITIPTKTFITEKIKVNYVHFISPVGLNELPCGGGDHIHNIGDKRPIAVVMSENGGMRLCYECSKHLKETVDETQH